MTYQDVMDRAKDKIGLNCKVCKECNGIACKGRIPGPGGKGTGMGFIRNYRDVKNIALHMNTIHDVESVDTKFDFFGKTFAVPVFAGPIGAVQIHYSNVYSDLSYSEAVVKGCAAAGAIAFTGDGVQDEVFIGTAEAIKNQSGIGVPTIKPWKKDEVIKKIRIAESAGAVAVAMDIDAAGLAILAAQGKPVAPMPMHVLREVIGSTNLPFVVKGIMTTAGAISAAEAGAYAIIVSNHGGRVLDETPSTISMLPEIVAAVKGKTKIIIDGGFRSGLDIFKALALGADAVMIARPFVTAVYGGDFEGVELLVQQYKKELEEAMLMTGCRTLADIDGTKVKMV